MLKKGLFVASLSMIACIVYNSSRGGIEAIFTDIYDRRTWGHGESASGAGSSLAETERVRQELPELCRELQISSLLDAPCGDFHWMKEINLSDVLANYIGADIVPQMIAENEKQYGNANVRFVQANIATDDLPKADLILCRDCLVHLSFDTIKQALRNFKRSGAKYLLATNFMETKENCDVGSTRQGYSWRRLNLLSAPFNLPEPIKIIDEGMHHKSLALWRLDDINVS